MKKPLIIIVIAIVIIGAGVAVYLVTQSEDTNTNAPTNSAIQTNTSAATNTSADTNTESADRYIGDDFTILQPADWTQSQISGTLVSFHNTSEVNPEGSAAKKINFQSYMAVSFDMVNERSLAEINDLTIDQIKASIPSAEVIASSDETINGRPAKFSVLTLSQQEVDYTVFIAVTSKGDKYYAISGNTTTDKWTDYEDLFYQTARSFVFKNF
ncbi:photosystem II reaction center PsbP family protein [Patescibacteria group bacterium]|nr:photosystem II reaction center PsbP family protein [Patescibacteria group bacterium]MBU0964625.1 photosystem II reaction center PsbP family protein [Patescibacteria group bacterium]